VTQPVAQLESREPTRRNDRTTVPYRGDIRSGLGLFLFVVIVPIVVSGALLAVPAARAQDDVWTGVERIVAVGDVHGGYERFVRLLAQAGLVDKDLNWTGGSAHLVQTGDVVDKGPHARKALDLLRKLEEEAPKSGGRVHFLIGNHEALRLFGDLTYTEDGEFAEFRTADAAAKREELYQERLRELAAGQPEGSKPKVEPDDRRKFLAKHPLKSFQFLREMSPSGAYGRWIASHNAIIRLNDVVFVHGGISPQYSETPLRKINETVRRELRESRKEGSMAMDPLGPLWYRGLARGASRRVQEHLDAFLKANEAKRIVIAHTEARGGIAVGLGGRVVNIDVEAAGVTGPLACLVVEKGVFYELRDGKRRKL
jgi:hypothetical protein